MASWSFVARAFAVAALLAAGFVAASAPADPGAGLPQDLRDTGFGAPGALAFAPQYPLWTDGADKERWMRLPRGQAIDASDPDAWQFPPGTQLWKSFRFGGRVVETRYIERGADGNWRFGTYVWNEAGTDAQLAPARGTTVRVDGAPGGRYAIPSRTDCLACHASTNVPVLGVSALQLSPDRDPLAPGAKAPGPQHLDLRALVARGFVRGLPRELLDQPPRIAADTPVERAALGYLHGNCAHCHNGSDNRVPVRLTLAQRVRDPRASRDEALRSAVQAPSRWRAADTDDALVIHPGHAASSALAQRMQSRDTRVRMPPLATQLPDPDGLAVVLRWINDDLTPSKEKVQ